MYSDDERASIRGVVTSDGLFDGTINTVTEEYFVEPASRYGSTVSPWYHSIAYRSSDVAGPPVAGDGGGACMSETPHVRRARRSVAEPLVNQTFDTEGVILIRSPNGTIVNRSRQSVTNKASAPKPNWYDPSDHPRKVPPAVSMTGDEATNNLVLDDGNYDSSFENRKKGIGGFVDARKTTCMLYLQADHLFYEKYGQEETCIEVMTRHVQRVNAIYKNTGKIDTYTVDRFY